MQESIAIIGISFELPNIKNWKDLVASLENDNTFIDNLSQERSQDIYNRFGFIEMAKAGYLLNIDQFDNKYFGISEREAINMPPEHRLFLTHALRAFYNAGYTEERLKGSNTGIFYTGAKSVYSNFLDIPFNEFDNLHGIEGTRLANFLDLRGPVISINTTCSSSLVAVNNAILSLKFNECDKALVGGITISAMTKETAIKATVVSKKELCKPFDDEADGMMNGEGAIFIILKRLEDAENDGDAIYGIIKGNAINHGGSRISSLIAPSSEAQKEVILKAWESANIRPNKIRFIEAHGTGTILGDPIEFAGIKEAFIESGLSNSPCSISSFKGQVGHLDYLSGLAGLLRLIAALNSKIIPVQANFNQLNKNIDDENCLVKVQKKAELWKSEDDERIGGVSSFGLSGTNVHLVVSQKEESKKLYRKDWFYLQISENNEERLRYLKSNIIKQLEHISSNDIGYFCQKMNRLFQLKNKNQGFVFSTIDDLKKHLKVEEIHNDKDSIFFILDLEILAYHKNDIISILQMNELIKSQWEKNISCDINSIEKQNVLNVLFQFTLYKYLIARLGKKIKFVTKQGKGIIEQLINNEVTPSEVINNSKIINCNKNDFEEDKFKKYLEDNYSSEKVILLDFSKKNKNRFDYLNLELKNISGDFLDLNRFSLYKEILNAGVYPLKSHENPMFTDLVLPYFNTKRFWPKNVKLVKKEDELITTQETPKLNLKQIKNIVKKIWSSVLDFENFGESDDFFELGGTSLKALDMLVDLRNKINGAHVSYEEMFDYATIDTLSQVIYDRLSKQQLEQIQKRENQITPPLENKKETKKEKSFDTLKSTYIKQADEFIKNVDYETQQNTGNVLLLGGTGFLGIHLLNQLIEKTGFSVYLIVRSKNGMSGNDRIRDMYNKHFGNYDTIKERVTVFTGEATKELFGLKKEKYEHIEEKIDIVLNSAANVKHYGKIDYSHDINVKLVNNLLTFCKNNKAFHHVSTMGVADSGSYKTNKENIFTDNDYDLGQEYNNIYLKTKFEAEKRIINSKKAKFFNIYRVGNLTFDSNTGCFQDNINENAFFHNLKMYLKLGLLPEFHHTFDFSFVNETAVAIVAILQRNKIQNEIFHVYNPNQLTNDPFIHLLNECSIEIKKASLEEFKTALELNLGEYNQEIRKLLLSYGYYNDDKNTSKITIYSFKTFKLLEKIGVKWSILNKTNLQKLIDYMETTNFIR